MKNLFYILFVFPLLFSCADASETLSNPDARAFCDCVNNPTPECERYMEKLEEEFQKDKKRYKAFAKGAREECPDAEEYISRMN